MIGALYNAPLQFNSPFGDLALSQAMFMDFIRVLIIVQNVYLFHLDMSLFSLILRIFQAVCSFISVVVVDLIVFRLCCFESRVKDLVVQRWPFWLPLH